MKKWNGFDFGDFEITKREILASISIIAVLLLIGFIISGKISDHLIDKNEKYNKAVKIKEQDLFEYGMRTDIGNAFVYGDLEAVDTVTYPEIGGKYMYVRKVEEHYTMHTRQVAHTTTVNGHSHTYYTTEVYWSSFCEVTVMGRAERRREQKSEQKSKTVTYNLTKEQLDAMVREKIGNELVRVKKEATDEAVNTALTLLLTLPLEVLMDHFWKKSYPQKIPKFADLLIEYYEKWQDGELDLDELKEDLWKYGGVKFREGQINGK